MKKVLIFGESGDIGSNVRAFVNGKDDDEYFSLAVNRSDLDFNSNGFMLSGQTVGGSNGDLVYLSSANTWTQADADAAATASGMLAIKISATTVLTQGVYTTTGLTAANTYYVSLTAGGITNTKPSATADVVRVIGYALSTTELYFNPDGYYHEIN